MLQAVTDGLMNICVFGSGNDLSLFTQGQDFI